MKSRTALLSGTPLPSGDILPQPDTANIPSSPTPQRSIRDPKALECDDDCPFCQGPETD